MIAGPYAKRAQEAKMVNLGRTVSPMAVVLASLVLWVSFASGLPAEAPATGSSGLRLGGGGIFGLDSGRNYGFVQGEYDFTLSPWVSLGPEAGAAFDDHSVAPIVGVEGRVYLIPNYNFIIQPHALFGGGYTRYVGDNALYLRFGGGTDFEIPIRPYFDIGVSIYISPTSDGGLGAAAALQLEGGVRFDL